MREILFRGKRVDNGEWVEGSLLMYHTGRTEVVTTNEFGNDSLRYYEVLPETVGQWTGLYDKNKARIWEGDIVKGKTAGMGDVEEYEVAPARVDWNDRQCGYMLFGWHGSALEAFYALEVIGNINDTPSLLNDKT